MAKVAIKSEKLSPFGGIFHVREHFSRFVGPVIDKVMGLRCTSFGYQYSEIVGSLSSVYFCGGNGVWMAIWTCGRENTRIAAF